VASVAIDDRGIPPDEAASRLFEEHSEWLLAFCTRQLRDRSDAEDAVQATFLYAFRALRNGVVPECERAWLTTIAKNVCHTHRRTSGRHPESALEPDLDRIALAQPDHAEAGFMDNVRAALSSLPENQRRALLMREWRGASSNEIATELHLSEPATDALLFRARKSFASAISASGGRPFAALNVATLLYQLRGWAKPLLGGAAVKVAVATTAASVVVGGVVVEQQRSDGDVQPPSRSVRPAATVGATPEPSPESRTRATTPVVTRTGKVAPPAATPTLRSVRESAAPSPAQTDTTVTRLVRPPRAAAPPPAPSPPRAKAPSPTLAPPADPPVPAPPVELPPILGEEPPVQLPPPVEDLLPPVAPPPLPLAPLDKGKPHLPE
jgi:RNA polymerase sigma factor (sigma-70 family)